MPNTSARTCPSVTSKLALNPAQNKQLEAGDHVVVTVQKQSPQGEGIAFCGDKEIYIPLGLCGEEVEVELGEPFARGSKRCLGKVLRYLKPSAQRVYVADYECAAYEQCGGCQLMHVQYKEQLRLKQSDIAAALRDVEATVGHDLDIEHCLREVVPCNVRPCRFKSLRYFAAEQGQLELGFYAARSHELVAVESCPLEPARFATLSQSLLQCCRELQLSAYDEGAAAASAGAGAVTAGSVDAHGQLRALLWRQGDGDEILGCLIVSGPLPDAAKQALAQWAEREKVTSFSLGYNSKVGNALFTSDIELLHGKAGITKTLMGLKFNVFVPTFLQVNYEICEQLYQAAIAHCVAGHNAESSSSESSADVALDLCCGVGTMTLALAQHFAHVVGVEIVPDAISAAADNAQLNGITNTRFIAADLKQVLPQLLKEQKQQGKQVRAIIADPARVGLGAANVKALAAVAGPCKLSLIFCALPALKRDLPELLQRGFNIDYVQGFDMFPHSSHVETLVLLSKSKAEA